MINKIYLEEKTLSEMKVFFKQQKILLLPNFLEEKTYKKFTTDLFSQKEKEIYSPSKFRYSELEIPKEIEAFLKKELKTFLEKTLNEKQKDLHFSAKKFKHQSFTLLHDDFSPKDRKELSIFFLKEDWNNSFGGNKIYQGNPPKIISPQKNALVLFNAKAKQQNFIKYINSFAEEKSFILIEAEM